MRMRWTMLFATLVAMAAIACDRGGSGDDAPEAAPPQAEGPPGTPAVQEVPPEEAAAVVAAAERPEDGVVDGVFHAHSFNIRFSLPEGWERSERLEAGAARMDAEDTSLVFVGPEDTSIQMVVANTESIQLVDNSFAALNDRISLTNVTFVPDRSERRTFNGIPGYRTEGDATLRGEGMPVYFISQALELPGDPVMVTIFIDGDKYFEHSRTMIAVLDSIEVIDFRR